MLQMDWAVFGWMTTELDGLMKLADAVGNFSALISIVGVVAVGCALEIRGVVLWELKALSIRV